MAISIRDPETDRLAREVAALTGETITDTIGQALRERLAREKARHGGGRVAQMTGPFSSADHDELFYDDLGLPR